MDKVELLREFADFVKRRYDLHVSDGLGASPHPVDPDSKELARTFLSESKKPEQEEWRNQ